MTGGSSGHSAPAGRDGEEDWLEGWFTAAEFYHD